MTESEVNIIGYAVQYVLQVLHGAGAKLMIRLYSLSKNTLKAMSVQRSWDLVSGFPSIESKKGAVL